MSRCCDHSHQQPPAHPEHVHDHDHAAVPQPADAVLTGACNTRIRIEQMDCPTEERLIRDALGRLPGVAGLHFNLLQRVLTVSHDEGMLAQVLPAIRALGFTPQIEDDRTAQQPAAAPAKKNWWPLALAGGVATASEVVHFAGLGPDWLVALLAVAAILMCGLNTYKKGWIALKNRNLNINALMSIAVTGAVLIGQWPEAAMVMVLFTLAELIEARSLDRARNAIRGLMDLAPPRATVQQADGSWQEIDVQAVGLGAVVRVRPGERISLDGEVVAAARRSIRRRSPGKACRWKNVWATRCSLAPSTRRARWSSA